jgi:hypothetical protein
MTTELPPIEWFYKENSQRKVADWRKFEQYREMILAKFPYLRGRPRVDIWNGFKAGEPIQPKCQVPECDKPVKLLASGWKKYCCNACSNIGTAVERARVIREKTPEEKFEILEKRKNANKEKFGVEHAAQSEIIREKTTRTNIERYGVMAPAQSAEIKELMKLTNQKKYGVDWGLQETNIRAKRRETMMEKYGTEHALQNDISKEKRMRSNIDRFGVPYAIQNEEVRERTIKTIKERYGSEFFISSKRMEEMTDEFCVRNSIKFQNQKNFSDLAKSVLFDRDSLSEFYDPAKTLTRNAEILGIDRTTLVDYLDRYCISRPEWIEGSQAERDISEYIETLGFDVERNRRDLLEPSRLEIDIFVPELNIAFEYNGLYWHSYGHVPTTEERRYHRMKYELAQSNGIKLFFLTSDLNKEKIMRFVASKLKKSRRIFARKCQLFTPSITEYKQFCEENHIQGYTSASIRYALRYEGRMVGAVGFNRVKDDEWILNRMVFCDDMIVGGAKKLLTTFRREYSGRIISYSSNHYSDGSLYLNLGFVMTGEHDIDLWYVKNERFVNRRNLQKKKMKVMFENFDPTITEISNALNNKYRVYCGPGTKTWVLE